jgi:sugar phosphate isomerase/epimerase
MREINSPWVRVNLDVGNYVQPNIYEGIEASLAYAPHVVAKIHQLSPQGEELEFDYDRIFSILKRHRYHGFVTVEYEGKTDELASVPKALDMLRRYALKHGM